MNPLVQGWSVKTCDCNGHGSALRLTTKLLSNASQRSSFNPSSANMPGSSRMPVSLRNTFTVKKRSSNTQLLALNIDLYVNILIVPSGRVYIMLTWLCADFGMWFSSYSYSDGRGKRCWSSVGEGLLGRSLILILRFNGLCMDCFYALLVFDHKYRSRSRKLSRNYRRSWFLLDRV